MPLSPLLRETQLSKDTDKSLQHLPRLGQANYWGDSGRGRGVTSSNFLGPFPRPSSWQSRAGQMRLQYILGSFGPGLTLTYVSQGPAGL